MSALAVLGTLAAATPSPSPGDVELTPTGGGSPGFVGFVVTFLLALAAIGLFLSLTKQLRVVDRRAKQLGLDDAPGARTDGGASDGTRADDGERAPQDGTGDAPGPRA